MVMRILIYLLVLMFVGVCFIAGRAQDKPKPETDSLVLLPFEMQRKKELSIPLEKAAEVLNKSFESCFDLKDDQTAAKCGYRVSAALWQLTLAKNAWETWLLDVRKSHKCLECDLVGDQLIPKPKNTVNLR